MDILSHPCKSFILPVLLLHNGSLTFHSSWFISSSYCTFSKSSKTMFGKNLINPLRASTAEQKYFYPDPIPEFAEYETKIFRSDLLNELSKNKEEFGNDIDQIVDVCVEIMREFLRKEYGGPGTLVVEPFTDMLLALRRKKVQGSSLAARVALLWAQNYLDQDWDGWITQKSGLG